MRTNTASSAIGAFAIGVSPVGVTWPGPTLLDTIISQYANSPTMMVLLSAANEWLDPTKDIEAFYSLIWNVDTAQGYGLDVWGRIVGVDRNVTISADPPYFGFRNGIEDWTPFNDEPFFDGQDVTNNFRLADDAFRTLILVKAMANIARTDAPSLNALLRRLFNGRGRAYVNDLGSMQMRFTFEFYLQPYELAILTQSGVLPHPTGVGVSILQAPGGGTFGFNEAGDAEPFGQGTFFSQENIIYVD